MSNTVISSAAGSDIYTSHYAQSNKFYFVLTQKGRSSLKRDVAFHFTQLLHMYTHY